jgi:hypothetical protein
VPGLQQFINANPALVVVVVFIIGAIAFLAARILLANFGCLARVTAAVVIIIAILLLLRFMLVR